MKKTLLKGRLRMKHKKLVSMIGMLVLLFSTVACSKNNKVALSDALEKNDIAAVEKIFSTTKEPVIKPAVIGPIMDRSGMMALRKA